jgi:hypothetical protein
MLPPRVFSDYDPPMDFPGLPIFRILVAVAAPLAPALGAGAVELGLPADCILGRDCFVQQFPDMDPGPGAVDPFCGTATYDGHDGIDLRILSMADVRRGIAVVAMADGKVLRLRDGVPDHLVATPRDAAAVASRECGNGIVIDHGGGIEVQYCHMRQGSLAVKSGDGVRRGQRLGDVGASGLAQFPHVHVTVRRDGEAIDPATGRALSAGCLRSPETARPLLAPETAKALGRGNAELIAFGTAGGPLDHAALADSGPPPAATVASPAIVGWAWFINLRQGDRVVVKLIGPDGAGISANRSDPMDRPKASYSAFAGKKGSPARGTYRVSAGVERDGRMLFERNGEFKVE